MLRAKVKDIPTYVKIAWKQRKPIFLWGKPGIGKSTAVKQAAKELAEELGVDFKCIDDLRLSQCDPTDLGGLPFMVDGVMEKAYPAWVPTDGHGILFLDEFPQALPAVQSAAYQLVLDRKLGERKLGEGWVVVAAGNRASDKVTVYEMDSALQNRFPLHLEVEQPDEKELMDYFKSIDKPNAQVAGFLNFKPSRVWYFDEKSADPAWTSPRSWEFLIDLAKEVEQHKGSTEYLPKFKQLAEGCIGDVVGRELIAFLKLSEQVDIEKLLNNPGEFKDITRPDVRHSVITEIADRYAKDRTKYEKKCIDFVFSIDEAELTYMALNVLTSVNRNFIVKAMADKRADRLADYMERFI
ncbi:AAA family ATPase [Candidatus Woesearchaeota archaeon]|nr:AAA family ATPase [Candidatus Woesearchaeota archaeon]